MRLINVFMLTLVCAFFAQSQIIWTYSTRDAMTYTTGDSLNSHPKWRKIIDTSGGSPRRTLLGATASGQGQAAAGASTMGSGDRAGIFWDSTFVSDTSSFQVVWKQSEDSANLASGTAWLYFAMNDSNRQRWKGLAFKLFRWNSGGVNGGDYVGGFRRIDSTFDQPTVGDFNLAPGGFALRQNDTIRIVNYGGLLYAYWCKNGGAGTTLIDSSAFNALNTPYLTNPGRIAIRLRVSAVPPMLNTFMIGTKSGSAPAGILRDTIPPVISNVTSTVSTDSGSAFTISFQATDSNTTLQKNPGDDSLFIRWGTTYQTGVGTHYDANLGLVVANPDTVNGGDSLAIKAGTTKDTVVSKTFVKKSIGTYYYQPKAKDDTANTNLGARRIAVIGSAVQNPFKVGGYFYTQTLSSWWPAIQTTPSILGDLAANQDVLFWFYDNADTASPYLKIRTANNVSSQVGITQLADSLRFFGYDRNGGTRNILYQFRDSIHAHGNKIALSISAITASNPATAIYLTQIAADTNKSKIFAGTLAKFCQFHQLDGVDFNWEFPVVSDTPNMFQFLKKVKDSLTTRSWNGQTPIVSMGAENLTSVGANKNYSITATDSLCTYMTIESSSRISGHGGIWTGNPEGILRPTINSTNGLPGDTVKGFDSYVRGDTTYQGVPQYVTVNGFNAAGLRKSKGMQILSAGVEFWNGISGAGQPVAAVLGSGQLGESNGGSSLQTYFDQDYSFTRSWRDSSNNTYLAYVDVSGVKRMFVYDDSVSIGQTASMLKTRGYSSFMYNEACWLLNSSGWRGNLERLSYLHWMRAAANSPIFVTVGAPTPTTPSNGSTGQGSVASGTVNVTFTWNKVSNASEGYRISVCSNPRFDVAITGGDIDVGTTKDDTTIAITGLAANTLHYWKVAPRMGRFYGYNSKVQRFTTAAASSNPVVKAHKPILLYPASGATSQPLSVTLKWHQPSGFTDTVRSYYMQISTDPTFTSYFKYDSTVSPGGVTLPDTQYTVNGLSYSGVYYWHVKSLNAVGDSGYASNFSFTVQDPSTQPTSPPSFKKTMRWFDDSCKCFRQDAPPPMLMKTLPLSQIRPPRKADGTIDTATAWISPSGIVTWDSTVRDFSKMGDYLLTQGNNFTQSQSMAGLTVSGSTALNGNLTSNLTPINGGTSVGVESLGTVTSPFKSVYTNQGYKIFLRNGNYITDSLVGSSDITLPNTGALLWEDFLFGGRSAISIAPGGVSVASVGQNRYSAYSVSASAAASNSSFQKPSATVQDSVEPGIMAMTLGADGTLGTANGLVFSMKGDSVFGSVNCRINGLVQKGKFYTPSAIDSLTIAMGLSAQSDSLGYVWSDSTKAGVAIYTGGRRANGASDTIWAYASNGTGATTTKTFLAVTAASRWYKYQIWQTANAAYFMLWSDADNYTSASTASIVSNLPTSPTMTHPFMSAFSFDKSGTKIVKFGYQGLFTSGVRR